ncbi:MAG: ABC transporter permease subunit [Spirochaetia bacterium]|jgi:NitT/TauT family transport system permease protein
MHRRFLGLMGGLAAMIAVWWALSLLVPDGFIPAPDAVGLRFLVLFPGALAAHSAASLGRVAAALALSILTAVPAGIAVGRNPVLGRILSPILYVLYPVPKIALLPLLMLLFGLGDSSKVLIVFLVLFFQVLVAVRDAAREVPPQFLLSLRSLGGTRRHAVLYVLAPALIPAILSSLRIGTGTALAVLFFSETFGTRVGLGWFVMESWMRMSYVDMFAGILCLGLLGLAVFVGIDSLQRRLCRWQADPASMAT